MAVPSADLSSGVYFGHINGDDVSAFASSSSTGNSSYRRACLRSGKIYMYNTSTNTATALYNLVYLPYSITPVGWDIYPSSDQTDYYSSTFNWSKGFSGKWIRHTKYSSVTTKTLQYDYPITIAYAGYRTRTISTAPSAYFSWSSWTGSYLHGKNYYIWANRALTFALSSTSSSSTVITLRSTGYSITGSTTSSGTWDRKWVGVALQAGGASGRNGHIFYDGSSGAAGAFWFGLINIENTNAVITISRYAATTGSDGVTGSAISVTGPVTLSCAAGTVSGSGGTVTYPSDGSNIYTFAAVQGGYGGHSTKGGTVTVSTFNPQTPDQQSIPFEAPARMGQNNDTGSGGCSVYATGGFGGGHATAGGNSGQNISFAWGYGAGGGGGGWKTFGSTNGGSGGYAYVIVGW